MVSHSASVLATEDHVSRKLDMARQIWPDCCGPWTATVLRLRRINQILQERLNTLISQYDLQQADFDVLMSLRVSGEPYCLKPTELCSSMLFSSGGLTKVLSRLQQARLICRSNNPDDLRCKYVKLTPAGAELVENIIPKLKASHAELFVGLTSADHHSLDTALQSALARWEVENH